VYSYSQYLTFTKDLFLYSNFDKIILYPDAKLVNRVYLSGGWAEGCPWTFWGRERSEQGYRPPQGRQLTSDPPFGHSADH
jgi:hypothetical protein